MTTVAIWDNILSIIEKKRDDIYRLHGRRLSYMDIASAAIIRGLDNVEDELGLSKSK